jgi:molecular chaperone GrpE (heat shock protein)
MIKKKSIYDKKLWLKARLSLILSMKNEGRTQKEILEYLKTKESMPFTLDASLFSRHLRNLISEKIGEKRINKIIEQDEKNQQYQYYLENSNKDLLKQIKELKATQNSQETELSKINTLEAQNQEYEKQIQQKDRDVKLLKQQVRDLMAKTHDVSSLNHLKENNNELKNQISAQNQEIINLTSKKDQLKEHYLRLKSKFEDACRILEEQHQTILKHEMSVKQSRIWRW